MVMMLMVMMMTTVVMIPRQTLFLVPFANIALVLQCRLLTVMAIRISRSPFSAVKSKFITGHEFNTSFHRFPSRRDTV